MFWCNSILYSYLRAVFMRIPFLRYAPDSIGIALFLLALVLSLKHIHVSLADIVFFLGALSIFLLSPLLHPDTLPYWEDHAAYFILRVLPCYLLGLVMIQTDDKGKLVDFLYVLSCVTVIMDLLYQFLFGSAMSEIQSRFWGNMSGAYNLLPHLCLIAYYVITSPKWYNLVLWFVGSVYLLFLGTRGPVLCEFLCVVGMVCFFATWKHKKLILTIGSVLMVCFVFSPYLLAMLRWLRDLAAEFGLSVRIFDFVLSNSISDSTGRNILAEKLIRAMDGHGLFGLGLYADRRIMGSYAHNLVLELCVDFGYMLGSVFFAAALIIPTAAFFVTKVQQEKGIILVLFCANLLSLMLSSSYLEAPNFFFLLGASSCILRKHSTKKLI